MDNEVNDFLNEINEIAPPPSSNAVQDEVWKQCYDELSGYAYYWNKQTDEVTWDPPIGYKNSKTKPVTQKLHGNLYLPKNKDIVPESGFNTINKNSIKIYSVGENSKNTSEEPKGTKKSTKKRCFGNQDDSEDEKIVLISSYGSESESEEEPPHPKKTKMEKSTAIESDKLNSENDDDLDILTKIQKRAQELKELGGDVPAEIKKVVESSKKEIINAAKSDKIPIGQSLVSGYYTDSEEEEEEENNQNFTLSKPDPVQISHSTLFPVPQPINVNDFVSSKPVSNNLDTNTVDNFDAKLFKRKKKIALPVVTTAKKDFEDESRKGFGFDKDTLQSDSEIKNENLYLGFKKGGVAFVKSEDLNPTNNTGNQYSTNTDEILVNKDEIDSLYSTLKDKLTFLNEGRPPISSVQIMVVQAETLIVAMKDGALKGSYLKNWLVDTCSELKKLEKEAAPIGWTLQWDRMHRRYFYQNRFTGSSQWEYPQPDMNTSDVAMDISTTPPPPSDFERPPEELSPPLPPMIRSPTPPPPPVISLCIDEPIRLPDVPLPSEQKKIENGQPLPPGVDSTVVAIFSQQKDSLNSALDSFYSDIAAITSPSSQTVDEPPSERSSPIPEVPMETVKKKKKSKVKLAPGLSMKKKGVSQLVEKWKSVQQEYKN